MMNIGLKKPTTRAEAERVAQFYAERTARTVGPKGTVIIRSVQKPLFSPTFFLPTSPFAGPPLPWGAGTRWTPDELHRIKVALGVSNPIPQEWVMAGLGGLVVILGGVLAGSLLGQGFKPAKPHKQMKLDNVPESIPEIHCYVLKLKLEGNFKSALKNLSDEVDIPGGGEIKTTLNANEEKVKEQLINNFEQANEKIPAKEVAGYLLKQAIKFEGAWDVIKALWDLLVNKKIKVHIEVPTKIKGYETDKFVVDDYAKQFSIDAEVKVENLYWHAW